MRATIFNWSARLLPVGKTVVSGVDVANALVNVSLASMARLLTRLYSLSSKWVRGCVIRVRRAAVAALEPKSGLFSPFIGTEPLVETWYWTAVLPAI